MRPARPVPWHQYHHEEVLRLLEVEPRCGLIAAEAKRRQGQFGLNRISNRRGPGPWLKFLQQFNAPLIYILLVAVAVTAFLGEWVDSMVILAVVLFNAVVGFLQEARAEKSIDALSRLVHSEATVRRDGQTQRVPSEQLVPGDIVLLESGDRVPADLRLFHVKSLSVDESALTGESVPVRKHSEAMALDTLLADQKNLAFAGTLVTGGHAEGVVWAIGDETQTGHIARLIANAVELSTPLTKKIAHFSRLLLWAIVLLAAATFAFGVARGEKLGQMFMAAVALAVGAVPEGLPAAVTIVLAIGVARMARRRTIIRKLPAVETLGSTTVICSDKTGTLTENQMTVQEIFAGGRFYEVTGTGYEPAGEIRYEGKSVQLGAHPALAECLRAGLLCNDARLVRDEDGRYKVQGDPTEAALLVVAGKAGLLQAKTHDAWPRVDVLPFESEHMFRATLHDAHGGRVIYNVGAAERLLDRCIDALEATGELVTLDRAAVHRAVEQMAARGLRVLALTRRHTETKHARLDHTQAANRLTFLGLQGMVDPPRPAVLEALQRCREAGIEVKMITGDHAVTARAIARQIGLAKTKRDRTPLAAAKEEPEGPATLTGRDLEKLSDAQLPRLADETTVFARVAPEQKLRLVRALQSRGHVVAMTGDGVNDAPALKQADIGVAMGIGGTDVAKNAAAMVLTDDNFTSIEAAVEEGRGVFDNITKFIVWILPTNLGEALLIIAALVLSLPLPALPLQLLWINLTDTLLGLPLAFEPKEKNVMRRPPRKPQQPLLTYPLIMRTGLVSLLMLAGALWLFTWELGRAGGSLAAARTAAVNMIVLTEVAYLFNCRSLHQPFLAIGPFTNLWAILGVLMMLAAQLAFTYLPVMNALFHTAPLGIDSWLRLAGIATGILVVVEFEKWIRFGQQRGEHAIPE